jgi:hypothetical protein
MSCGTPTFDLETVRKGMKPFLKRALAVCPDGLLVGKHFELRLLMFIKDF